MMPPVQKEVWTRAKGGHDKSSFRARNGLPRQWEVLKGALVADGGMNDKRTLWIVVGLVGAAVVAWFLVKDGRTAESIPEGGGSPRGDAAAQASPIASGLLAPAGHVVRSLDLVQSPVLRLGLVDGDGAGRLCEIGRARGDGAPLDVARCRGAEAEELVAVRREFATTPQAHGSRSYHVNAEGTLLATRDGDTVAVGPMPPAPEAIRVCESADVDVVAIDGDLVHGVRQTAIAFLGPTGLLGAVMTETHIFEYHFECRPEEARLTWLEADVEGETPIYVVNQAICDRTTCRTVTSRVARAGTDPMVASLAGQVLLVYRGDDGTRMRLAPITEIAETADLEVSSDGDAPVLSRALFARGGAAIVTIRSTIGVRALRVDATGTVAELRVENVR